MSIRLQQLSTFSDLRFAGPINVEFRVIVRNETDAEVVLRRIEVRTVGGGAYSLNEPAIPVDLTIAPKSAQQTEITARGYSLGGNMSRGTQTSIRATGYFDGPNGAFMRTANQNFLGE